MSKGNILLPAKSTPFSIPVLETDDFGGVIMTRARSLETWGKAKGTGKDVSRTEFPFNVVGKDCYLDATFHNAGICGESSGTAQQLAASFLQYNIVLRNYWRQESRHPF
ncbi:hypothetical protein ARMSODRAFT_1024095 [Armillaria solidipes]|uniref:Uncharacterized protein n=1 Tax=Armillaria solidipes TaxID=1076256 RepID=A0A2H3B0U9_9AGAR|nr:hypothetical protein ARMSODRAFT_1024095 [Armillaria solidipes]